MAIFGGLKTRKKARKDDLAEDDATANNSILPCGAPVTTLQVNVVRSDTGDVIKDIVVKAANAEQISSGAGQANFGEVAPGRSEIEVKLNEEQKKQFEVCNSLSKLVPEKFNFNTSIVLDPVCMINLVIMQWDAQSRKDKPCEGIEWALKGDVNFTGTTTSNGLINAVISINESHAELNISLPAPINPSPALVSETAAPTDYPLPVQHSSWGDVNNYREMKKNKSLSWSLYISDLDQGDKENNVNARLYNMGFNMSAEGSSRHAIKAYQALYLNDEDGSGLAADIEEDITARHDSF